MYRALAVWCVDNYFLTLKRCFFYLIAMKIYRQILSLGETLVYVHLEKLCLFWSIQFYCRGKRNRKFITINNNNDNNNNNNFKTLLYSGKCFGFWDVFLDSGKCFGFWEAFQFLGSVLQLSVDFRLSVLCSLGDLPALKTSLSLINRVSY